MQRFKFKIMAATKDYKAENERLSSLNFKLNSNIKELRCEISYYQGEVKRLEWDKNSLKQDIGKMSALLKGWLSEVKNSSTRSILDDHDYFTSLVRRPTRAINDVLRISNKKQIIVTCQSPFYIEVILFAV